MKFLSLLYTFKPLAPKLLIGILGYPVSANHVTEQRDRYRAEKDRMLQKQRVRDSGKSPGGGGGGGSI